MWGQEQCHRCFLWPNISKHWHTRWIGDPSTQEYLRHTYNSWLLGLSIFTKCAKLKLYLRTGKSYTDHGQGVQTRSILRTETNVITFFSSSFFTTCALIASIGWFFNLFPTVAASLYFFLTAYFSDPFPWWLIFPSGNLGSSKLRTVFLWSTALDLD